MTWNLNEKFYRHNENVERRRQLNFSQVINFNIAIEMLAYVIESVFARLCQHIGSFQTPVAMSGTEALSPT